MDLDRVGHAQRRRHHGRPSSYGSARYEGGWPVYGMGYYVDPSITGYMTAQQPHPIEQCPDPANCEVHDSSVDTASMMAGPSDAGASPSGDATASGGM